MVELVIMNITFKDVLNQIDDYCQNFDVTSIDRGNKERAANRAIEHVKRRIGLPSDKRTYSFYYYQDQRFYDVPEGFGEFIQLYYDDSNMALGNYPPNNLNVPYRRWNVMKDTEILRSTGGYQLQNKVAFTAQNGGVPQLLLSGKNALSPSTINGFNTLTGLTFSSDVSNQAVDLTYQVNGMGSIIFDLDNTLTTSTVTISTNTNIQNLINTYSAYRLYLDFPIGASDHFTTVDLRFQTSAGNYYSVSAGTQYDGSVWAENEWSLLSFPFNNLSTVGTPDAANITSIVVVFNHSPLFAAFNNMRIGGLYQVNPDYMTCSFWSLYKGTDSTGATEKIILDSDNDICSFGDIAPDLIDPIAIKAALRLFPQLRGDISFWQMYKADYDETLKTIARTFPRQRTTGTGGATEILRG